MSRRRDDLYAIEERQTKCNQVKEAGLDLKVCSYLFPGLTANVSNGGTSNFGTLMTRGLGLNTFAAIVLQIPYRLCQTVFFILAI